jgi:hypothetical protein
MIDEILDQCIAKVIDYAEKEENMIRLESKILVPIMQHISKKFQWLSYSFQTVTALVILQTILIVYLVFKINCRIPLET